MNKKTSVFFNASIWYIVANCLGQGIMLLSSIIFTRIMSQEHFGLYTTYYSVVALLTPFVGANLFVGLNNGYFDFKEEIDIENALGRVCADLNVACPPCVSVISCGEVYNESTIEAARYYGITKCNVVKNN